MNRIIDVSQARIPSVKVPIDNGDTNLVASKIPVGTTILGVVGTYSNIKSTQRVAITNATAGGTVTATISAVNLANSIIKVTYKGSDVTNAMGNTSRVELTNSTTVTCYHGAGSASIIVYVEVVEFNGVKSLQSGVATQQNTTDLAVTITSVNMSKTLIFATGTSGVGGGASYYDIELAYYLSSSTQFMLIHGNTVQTVQWYVIEFN